MHTHEEDYHIASIIASKLKFKLENLTPKEIGKVCKDSIFSKHAWQIQQSKDLEDFISKMDRKVYHTYLKKYLK